MTRAGGSTRKDPVVRVGLFGFGIVGTGIATILTEQRAALRAACGAEIEVAAIAVRDADKPRAVTCDRRLLTTDARRILDDPTIDVVIEVIGGYDDARAIIGAALRRGAGVVTANKLVLAHDLDALQTVAAVHGGRLRYGASVCGGVPVLGTLDALRRGDEVRRVRGIVNGSTNFILTRMTERGLSLAAAMTEARRRGFLEEDPTLDVSGADAAQKLCVLTHHAFGTHLTPDGVATTGITDLRESDVATAHRRGTVWKLIARAERDPRSGRIGARVAPEEIPLAHLFATTRDEHNALEIDTRFAGTQVLSGKGAGSLPTASAVVSDLVELVRDFAAPHP